MPHCFLCGGATRFLFSSRDYARPDDCNTYKVNWCDVCDFGRLEGDFTPQTVQCFYPSNYYTHNSACGAQREPSRLERLRQNIAWRFDGGVDFAPSEVTGESICDLGRGAGAHLRRFKRLGKKTVGVDPDPLACNAARDAGDIFNGTAESLPAEISGRKFDVVLMSHVLEHCIDPIAAVINAKSLLAPDGSVVIEVPNNAAVGFHRFEAAWPWTDIPRHLNFFTQLSLKSVMQRAGLRPSKVFYTGYMRQFTPYWVDLQKHIIATIRSVESFPNPHAAAWILLFQTLQAEPSRRFDSVRIHATAG